MAGIINDPHKGGLFAGGGPGVGAQSAPTNLSDLNDVVLDNLSDNNFLTYDEASNTWTNFDYTLTTVGTLSNVDDSTKEDGSVLVYRTSSSKYETTTRLEQQTIIGGTF